MQLSKLLTLALQAFWTLTTLFFSAREALTLHQRSCLGSPLLLTALQTFYSLGAITHALLVGRAPGGGQDVGMFSRMRGRGNDVEGLWAERSQLSRDFVQKMIAPWDQRITPARALQHPWLKGAQPITLNPKEEDLGKEVRHKMLCYSLALLLVPVTLPFRDFEQLQQAFVAADTDDDGLIPRQHARAILHQRCNIKEAVDHALNLADIHKSDVFDLCSTACADLVAREFFSNGPTHQPLVGPFGPTEVAPRMLKKTFEVFGGRQQSMTLTGLKARLRTATLREVEAHAGVDYEELLSDFPDGAIDAQSLTSLLSGNAGRGTPLGNEDGPGRSKNDSIFGGGFLSLFQQCMAGGAKVREDSPF